MQCMIVYMSCYHLSVYYYVTYMQIDRKHFKTEGSEDGPNKKEGEEGEGGEEGKKTEQDLQAEVEPEDSLKIMTQLTKFIYNCPSEDMGRIRTRVMLCQIYHHALHDRYVLHVHYV